MDCVKVLLQVSLQEESIRSWCGDPGRHAISLLRPEHLLGYVALNHCRKSPPQCPETLSCRNQNFGRTARSTTSISPGYRVSRKLHFRWPVSLSGSILEPTTMSSTIKVQTLMMKPNLYSHPMTKIGYDGSRHWTHMHTTGFVSPQKLCKKNSFAACSCLWYLQIASVEDDRHESVCSPPVSVATQLTLTKHIDEGWLPVPTLTPWRTHMLLDGFCSTADVFSGRCP